MTPEEQAHASPSACDRDELSCLFLFQDLNEEQLTWLCRQGQVIEAEPGPVYPEGDPAKYLYVLLSGTVVLSRRIGDDDIEVNRSSEPGVYAGAFQAYMGDRVPQIYNNSLRVTERSRFYVLAAEKFAQLMHDWFPMAVHLLEGYFFGYKNTQEAIGQRERLLALGSLSAGLTHELNNPASAAVRATATLRERVAAMRRKLALIAAGKLNPATLTALVGLQEEAATRVAKAQPLTPLEASDREDEIADWLDDHDVRGGYELAAIFTQAGLDAAWLDQVDATLAETPGENNLDSAMHWLGYTVETELLMNEIGDSVTRISNLVGAAKQYSQLDRAPYQIVDVHELIDSTLVMLGAKLGDGITVVKDYAPGLPRIPAYPGELNQVWTNLIDNAADAMAGTGTLTVRTSVDRDHLLVDFGDTGPGIPPETQRRIFEPFFTTKPVGKGTGLGLDISWRIVANRHHGDLRVESVPGSTHFLVRLPLSGPDGEQSEQDEQEGR